MKLEMRARLVMVLCLIAVTASALAAAERRPLPDVSVSTLDGAPVRIADLAREGHWLLIYVEPSCGACTAVLGAMTREDHPGMAQRVTVVVGNATADQARTMAAASPELAEARWLVATDRQAHQALGARSAPVVMGVRTQTIEWDLVGVLRRGDEMRSVLVSWLKQSRP